MDTPIVDAANLVLQLNPFEPVELAGVTIWLMVPGSHLQLFAGTIEVTVEGWRLHIVDDPTGQIDPRARHTVALFRTRLDAALAALCLRDHLAVTLLAT